MKQIISHQTFAWMRWVCVWVIICSQLSQFPVTVVAQEPTTEPAPLPTPTPAATWTPTPVTTPNPGATATATSSTSNPTATSTGRLVDFRVDDDKIEKGDCVTFSWVVRGDIDRVEFDKRGDGKDPVLVSDRDSREECPDEDTDYELIVTWLDGTQTMRSIEIEIDSGGNGSDDSGSNGTTTPAATSVFVPVTPIPITITPTSAGGGTVQQATYQSTSGGAMATPVGALGSVKLLPETGDLSPRMADTVQAESNLTPIQPRWGFWLAFAIGLSLLLGVAVIGLILVTKTKSEAPDEG